MEKYNNFFDKLEQNFKGDIRNKYEGSINIYCSIAERSKILEIMAELKLDGLFIQRLNIRFLEE